MQQTDHGHVLRQSQQTATWYLNLKMLILHVIRQEVKTVLTVVLLRVHFAQGGSSGGRDPLHPTGLLLPHIHEQTNTKNSIFSQWAKFLVLWSDNDVIHPVAAEAGWITIHLHSSLFASIQVVLWTQVHFLPSRSRSSNNRTDMALPVSPAAIGGMAQLLIGGGLAVYGLTNSIFNVEGGHRAIVFNRLMGIKEEVRNLPTIVKNILRYP